MAKNIFPIFLVICVIALFFFSGQNFNSFTTYQVSGGSCLDNTCNGQPSFVDADGCQHWVWETVRDVDNGYFWTGPTEQGMTTCCGGWNQLGNLIGGVRNEFPSGQFTFGYINPSGINSYPYPPETQACTAPKWCDGVFRWKKPYVKVTVVCGGGFISTPIVLGDANGDGIISRVELGDYIMGWIAGSVSREALGTTIQAWIEG